MAHIPLDFPTNWAFAWSEKTPPLTGKFRSHPEDFCVDEMLGFDLDGQGEHIYFNIEKIGQNTHWVIEQLARQLGISVALFGHAGLKDRHAVTTQWLSVQSPTKDLDFDNAQIPGVSVNCASIKRHTKKLRPGMHAANKFRLQLRELKGGSDQLEQSLGVIRHQGFPNYFGQQRFGFDNQNLYRGWELLEVRRLLRHKKKGIYLSALRSFLFNQIVNQRVDSGLVAGVNPFDNKEFDNTGPLWGRGRLSVSAEQSDFEKQALQPWCSLYEALEYAGLNQERRPLMVVPDEMSWQLHDSERLTLAFSLPPGSYATSLLRELGELTDMSKPESGSSV